MDNWRRDEGKVRWERTWCTEREDATGYWYCTDVGLLLDDPLQVPSHDDRAQEALQGRAEVAPCQAGHEAGGWRGEQEHVQGIVGEDDGDGGGPGALR